MNLAEASRQYQATLEARRAAWDEADADDAEALDDELTAALRAVEVAWLNEHTA